jgi:MFS family permease
MSGGIMSQASAVGSAGSGLQTSRLFVGCFVSLVATSFGFIVRALLLNDFGQIFNLSETQKGAISGAGLFPFALSIVLFSLFIDRLGYGRTMLFAFLGHVLGTVLMIFSGSFGMLYLGTFILALANGAVEAATNPAVATMYPNSKTHHLNILHAGWPAGLVLGGVMLLLMGSLSWQVKVGIVLLPTALYGVLLLGQKFPVQERVAAGVSYMDMLKEFGAAGCFLLAYFAILALSTILTVIGLPEIPVLGALVAAAVAAVVYYVAVKSIGRPMFVFLLLVMILLATTELGVDSWVTDIMTPAFGKFAGWILVYTSFIMFVLRFFAGPLVHRLSPLGLLAVCAALATGGLLALSVSQGAAMVILAATLYGVGKSFFWPTTLGIVSEQFPKGGALTMNAMGGMGMIAVGVLGGPFLGTLLDRGLDRNLQADSPAIHAQVAEAETSSFGLSYKALDKKKISELPKESQDKVEQVVLNTKQGTLATIALLPATMFVCYLGLIVYFRSRGGYKVEQLTTT